MIVFVNYAKFRRDDCNGLPIISSEGNVIKVGNFHSGDLFGSFFCFYKEQKWCAKFDILIFPGVKNVVKNTHTILTVGYC